MFFYLTPRKKTETPFPMEQIKPEEAGGEGWNTDEILVGEITSEQAARMLTAFVSAFRLLYAARKRGGDREVMISAYRLMAHQMAIMDAVSVTEEEKKYAESAIKLGLMAIGQAMVASASPATDPRSISGMTENALGAVDLLIKKDGADAISNRQLFFNVKKGPNDTVFISTYCKSNEDLDSLLNVPVKAATQEAKTKIIKIGGLKKGENGKA